MFCIIIFLWCYINLLFKETKIKYKIYYQIYISNLYIWIKSIHQFIWKLISFFFWKKKRIKLIDLFFDNTNKQQIIVLFKMLTLLKDGCFFLLNVIFLFAFGSKLWFGLCRKYWFERIDSFIYFIYIETNSWWKKRECKIMTKSPYFVRASL